MIRKELIAFQSKFYIIKNTYNTCIGNCKCHSIHFKKPPFKVLIYFIIPPPPTKKVKQKAVQEVEQKIQKETQDNVVPYNQEERQSLDNMVEELMKKGE